MPAAATSLEIGVGSAVLGGVGVTSSACHVAAGFVASSAEWQLGGKSARRQRNARKERERLNQEGVVGVFSASLI